MNVSRRAHIIFKNYFVKKLEISMLKRFVVTGIICILFTSISLIENEELAWGQTGISSWAVFSSIHLPADVSGEACGEVVKPAKYFTDLSLYSLIVTFGLVFAGIFLDKKALKIGVWSLSLIPLILWVYLNYFVDYERLKRLQFTYNATAENTLANIAEAQDRYKSEQDTFIKDFDQLYSHMAGSHGIDECVQILKIDADWNHWSAQAKHVSSPDKVVWDSRTGSSLKKG
jgi:hypothetical protein